MFFERMISRLPEYFDTSGISAGMIAGEVREDRLAVGDLSETINIQRLQSDGYFG